MANNVKFIEDNNKMTIIDEGKEIELEILFTFEDTERFKKKYVLYMDPNDEDGNLNASIYDDEGNLYPIESDEEWEMVEEVFGAFVDESEGDEDEEEA